jgi:hypothetical protein
MLKQARKPQKSGSKLVKYGVLTILGAFILQKQIGTIRLTFKALLILCSRKEVSLCKIGA